MNYLIVNPQILTLYVWSYKDLSKIAFNHINFDHNDLRSCIRRMCHTWVSCFSQRSQSKASDFKLHNYITLISLTSISVRTCHILKLSHTAVYWPDYYDFLKLFIWFDEEPGPLHQMSCWQRWRWKLKASQFLGIFSFTININIFLTPVSYGSQVSIC